ncbi:hypothetical protein Q7C36_014517 [Tachysurus vachellii]|uniref:Uncharacterized protein n=1 Tax=Tachysurus vachellii TaxID=175792 RepID=A0AA88MHH1_TACVA|nr:hypothetical protein Q7C36_014517 [Tachysurus vachellii]
MGLQETEHILLRLQLQAHSNKAKPSRPGLKEQIASITEPGVDRLPQMIQCRCRRDPPDAAKEAVSEAQMSKEDVWPCFNEGREGPSASEEMSLLNRQGSYHGLYAHISK